MREHETIHQKEVTGTILECPKCKQQFERRGKIYEKHIENCNSKVAVERRRSYRYPCSQCVRKFVTKLAAADHLLEVHQVRIANVEKYCFECRMEVEDALIHARSHGCEFQCRVVRFNLSYLISCSHYIFLSSQCGLYFNTKRKLEKHLPRHEQDEDRPFTCDACPQRFKSNNHLLSHKKAVHATEDEKMFACSLCERRFAVRHMLNSHVRHKHSDVKRYNCAFCGMKFKKLETMKNHCRMKHGEENAYPCNACPEKLKTLNELRRHQQETHGGSFNVQKFHDTPID